MDNVKKRTLTVLNDLLIICQEEIDLFRAASENSDDPKTKLLFDSYAIEKEGYYEKLIKEIKRLGGDPGKTVAKKELTDFKIKSNKTSKSKQLIDRCIKFDNFYIKRYSSAVKADILWEVVPLLAKQYFASRSMHDQLMSFISPAGNRLFTGAA